MENESITTDREEIMDWAKERGGVPALFSEMDGIELEPELKINFAADDMDDRAQEVTWERFFEELDSRKLAFKYQKIDNDGTASSHYEFVNR